MRKNNLSWIYYLSKIKVTYGWENLSLTLGEERRLRAFENGVLRRIFRPKRDLVTGEWRKLHNEELSDLCSSSNIVRVIKSRRMRWAGHVARMGERRGVYRVLMGKPEGKNNGSRNSYTTPCLIICRVRNWISSDHYFNSQPHISHTGYPCQHCKYQFVGLFAKLRKATISFVMSICSRGSTRPPPTGRIFMKFDIWRIFMKFDIWRIFMKFDIWRIFMKFDIWRIFMKFDIWRIFEIWQE